MQAGQSWLDYALKSLHQRMVYIAFFWGSWDYDSSSCVFPLKYMVDNITPERSSVDFIIVMVHCLCDHKSSFPSLLLVYVVSVEKQKHICKQIFCNVDREVEKRET